MVVIRTGKLLLGLFGTKISLEIIFDDRLLRKQALLHYKKADFTQWPYWLFFQRGYPKIVIKNWKLLLGLFWDKNKPRNNI